MFIVNAGEEHLFEVLSIIFLVLAYPNDAILNDVGHNHFCFLSFYPYSMEFWEMLHEKWRNFQISEENLKNITNFGA